MSDLSAALAPFLGLDPATLKTQLTTVLATWGPRVLGAIGVLLVGYFFAKWLRRGLRRLLERVNVDPTLRPFVAALTYYAILTFTILAAIRLVGVDTTSFVTIVGAVGLAVALAFQGTLSNFAAGVMILLFRPFRVGDVVEIGGDNGSVTEVSIFSTRIDTPDNVRIIVPNSKVWGERIKNFSANATRRIDLVVGVSYEDDLQAVKATLEAILASDPRVLEEPAAVVDVLELASSSVNFAVRPWCRREDFLELRFELLRRIKLEIEAAGFTIPYPQTDLHVRRPRPAQSTTLGGTTGATADAKPS
jgi:small conductance mechanosensitive channel